MKASIKFSYSLLLLLYAHVPNGDSFSMFFYKHIISQAHADALSTVVGKQKK